MAGSGINSSLIIKLLFFFIFLPFQSWGGDWFLSYRLQSKNFHLIQERFSLARAMVPFQGKSNRICVFPSDTKNFKEFDNTHTQPLLECLFSHGVYVYSYAKIANLINQKDSLELVLPPVPLQVEFNDGLVIIKKVKSKK